MPDQPKKFRIVLKPLHIEDPQSEQEYLESRIAKLEQGGTDSATGQPLGQVERIARINQYKKRLAAMASSEQRVVDADLVAYIDDGTMLAGIDPGSWSTNSQAIRASRGHRKALDIRLNNPQFYHIAHTPIGVKPDDPSHTDYIITRKFKKILSINMSNIISVNGKPIMGRIESRDLDSGVQHLDFDESADWSIDNISDLLEE